MTSRLFQARIVVMLVGLVLLAACVTTEQEAPPIPAASLTNTYWKVQQVDGQATEIHQNQREPHLIFLDDGQVLGHTGCNSLKGRYGVNGSEFRFVSMAATRVACQDNTVEAPLLEAMKQTAGIVIKGDRMTLRNEQGDDLALLAAVYL